MLPIVTEEIRQALAEEYQRDEQSWKKTMIHRIKEDNPELNTLLLEMAQASADPKAVITTGYMLYQALEMALEQEEEIGL